MLCDSLAQKIARRSLAKVSPEYAAQRFDEISLDFVHQWAINPAPYRAALARLPLTEQAAAFEIFDLTVEWLSASDKRKAEIDTLGGERMVELERMGSRWYGVLINVYAPESSAIRQEWENCMEDWRSERDKIGRLLLTK